VWFMHFNSHCWHQLRRESFISIYFIQLLTSNWFSSLQRFNAKSYLNNIQELSPYFKENATFSITKLNLLEMF
jgi:hypothetical protein